ncbi:FtsH protease regulator HflK [compost metagenome]
MYAEYVKSPNVTSNRLTLETLEKILPKAKVIITEGSGNTVNYLPLNDLLRGSATGAAATGTGTGGTAATQGGGNR